ncbi:MAG: dTDP-4-dehydrorhamnose 3,5-epimerase [Saprospiraceae bacterium]|nr:dTDP-4-dehydrorhamnose 3,5-epimerase [Saprospiraceae bacterium]MCB9312067.1 dTDP-4-dehydrorhamnose 3,5-epimerase [Lewinellaceae bacterium]HRW75718.1 dTDP-4-dehydrorhamnose 3,5-epimerase [Saprospiraceae bacterium]
MPFDATPIQDLFLYSPDLYRDERGYFTESYNARLFREHGIDAVFVQDNQARSAYGVIRGLHYQTGASMQAKLVRVLEGVVLDVVVDLRPDSATYGRTYAVELSAENMLQLFVPRGFAHGYSVLSETAVFFYKCDNFYDRASEGGIHPEDPGLQIDWGIPAGKRIISAKDMALPYFGDHRPVND